MAKKLRNMVLGIWIFLGACGGGKKDFEFNLSGLKPWQSELFIKAGEEFWRIEVKRNDSSKNSAYLIKKPEAKAMLAQFYADANDGEINYRIAFRDEVKWVDCSKPNSKGWDFYRVAKHEWGHVLGHEHVTDIFSIMYHQEIDPYPIRLEFDFCEN